MRDFWELRVLLDCHQELPGTLEHTVTLFVLHFPKECTTVVVLVNLVRTDLQSPLHLPFTFQPGLARASVTPV